MENEKIIKSIRGPKETFEKLAQVAKDQGIDQGAALDALINCWNIQQAKGEIPGRAADIADFDAAIQQVQRAFLRSLELAQGAESRARASYAQQLDLMSGRIAQLEKDLKDWENLCTTKDKLYREATTRAETLQTRVNELTKRIKDLENQTKLEAILEKLTKQNGKTTRANKANKDNEPSEPPKLEIITSA